ncbi:MAG: phosphoglycerate mutase family protein [Lentisphaeria bacterium]|nr:phosphoglycerate mutase family protein [Lentisphaeria bacterium]
MLQIDKNIFSFADAVTTSAQSAQSVLVVRHSYRESLVNGNYDPGLTTAGWDHSVECGKLLQSWQNVAYGASSRQRTIETLRGLICGANLPEQEITPYALLHDTAMFTKPENLELAIERGTVPALLKEYFTTGTAPGMRHINEYVPELLTSLTTPTSANNLLLCTHDIVIVALLSFFKVYNFTPEDWCGYIQGAFLYRQNGTWNIAYAVPDKSKREPYSLFV